MGEARHGSATTTFAVRSAIQQTQASSLAHLGPELGVNPKTVGKWRNRATVEDVKTGPTEPRSTRCETEHLSLTLQPSAKPFASSPGNSGNLRCLSALQIVGPLDGYPSKTQVHFSEIKGNGGQ